MIFSANDYQPTQTSGRRKVTNTLQFTAEVINMTLVLLLHNNKIPQCICTLL